MQYAYIMKYFILIIKCSMYIMECMYINAIPFEHNEIFYVHNAKDCVHNALYVEHNVILNCNYYSNVTVGVANFILGKDRNNVFPPEFQSTD